MVSQLIREKQDSNALLSDSKTHILSIYYSVLRTEGAPYMFAVYDTTDDISELMIFFLSSAI